MNITSRNGSGGRSLRSLSLSLLLIPVLGTMLLVAGCSDDQEQSASTSPQTSQQRAPQSQQDGPRQMPKSKTLSSSEISDEQIQKTARIVAAVRMGTQEDRMKLRKDIKEKYGNPQQMDSTQKAQARKEMQRRQMQMQKKQMKLLLQEAKKEGMDPQTVRTIMRSAQQDSTLRKRLQRAMQAQMKKQQPQMNQTPNQ